MKRQAMLDKEPFSTATDSDNSITTSHHSYDHTLSTPLMITPSRPLLCDDIMDSSGDRRIQSTWH